jgi:hypothetical protein
MRLRDALVAAALVAVALVVAGCGRSEVSASPAAATPTAATTNSVAITTPAPSASSVGSPGPPSVSPGPPSVSPAPPSVSPGPPSVSPAPAVVMDPDLLQILPATIGTAKVEIEPDAFAEAIGDASFVAAVDSAAFAVVVGGEDLASGVVAHLRPGAYSDAFFRDWRDSYDEGACGQAGGVAGRAQITLAGRPVYVTTCTEELRVYHAYVPERDVIVSLFSLGEQRFGEQLLDGLRP